MSMLGLPKCSQVSREQLSSMGANTYQAHGIISLCSVMGPGWPQSPQEDRA